MYMGLSPIQYRWLVRPKWFTKLYIHNSITCNFNFNNKKVLDFGCGTGSICYMFTPENYLGIDCDHKRIAYANRLYPGYSFSALQGDYLPVLDNSIDYMLIISVLHHISSDELSNYLQEFHRVLKYRGEILIIEPCFFKNSQFNNYFMSLFDKGSYIRCENEYLDIFNKNYYKTTVLKRSSQLFFYNKLFFTATPV